MGLRAFIEKIFGKSGPDQAGEGRRGANGNGHGQQGDRRGKQQGKPGADMTLTCVECKRNFVFEAGEQQFYKMRGLTPPKRCTNCRGRRRRR